MQLSASTTPSDPTNLAALFATAGGSNPTEALTGADGLASSANLPGAFADLLADAAPTLPGATAAPVVESGAPISTSTASATMANFPSWLAVDAAPTSVSGNAPGPDRVSAAVGDDNCSTASGLIGPEAESETTNVVTTPARASRPMVTLGKPGRSTKSSNAREETGVMPPSALTPTPEPVAMPTVVLPGVTVCLPGGGDFNLRPSADETEFAREVESEDDKENLPAALTPVASRKEGKSSGSSRWPLAEDEDSEGSELASAPVSTPPNSARFSLEQPAAELAASVPGVAAKNTEATEKSASTSPQAASPRTPAFERSTGASALAATSATPTFARRTPVEPASIVSAPAISNEAGDFAPVETASTLPGASMRTLGQTAASGSREGAARPQPVSDSSATSLLESVASVTSLPVSTERATPSDEPGPTISFENSIPTRAEIFAAFEEEISVENKSTPTTSDKTFLTSAAKRVTTRELNLGIDVAKSPPVMPTASFTDRTPFVAPLERAFGLHGADASAAANSPAAPEPAVVAHRAVDAVMTAVERFSAGDRHSVQMQFSVGGADLSVRVELRGDEVRTTFRTDSAELRNALAHEWQAANGSHSDENSVRVAQPVFAARHNSDFSSFSGDTSSRQRDAQGRRAEAEDVFSSVASRPRAGSFTSGLDVSAAPAARAAVAGTALHLSTLA